MNEPYALEMKGVSKHFGDIKANRNVNLTLRHGEILAVLGENGSGKTTLMNMICGIYFPDEGEICIDGEPVVIASPRDAFRYKIGMVHQHFKLVDIFTAAENIALGMQDEKKYDIQEISARVKEISSFYGFDIDPDKKVYDMSVSEKQTVEIIKVLYRGADILILDEPTAVLTPQEATKLFSVIRRMRDAGKSIIIITHKLHEVLCVSDRVAILRKGEYITTVNTAETTESELTELMVGKKVELNIERSAPLTDLPRLELRHLCCADPEGLPLLRDVSLHVCSGEILGIAGIAGSGQRELLESIAGLIRLDQGEIAYHNPNTGKVCDLRDHTPMQIREMGVRLSFVPEDRLGMGLVGNMDIVDNMMLRSYRRGHSIFLDRKKPADLADRIIGDLQVATPNAHTAVRKLSGGNVQKVLVGREIAAAPTVLMTAYPVRGLDINSSYMIYHLLNEQKKKGVAIIFVGEDIDVLLALCDRVAVLCGGAVSGVLDARTATKEQVGYLMTRSEGEATDGN